MKSQYEKCNKCQNAMKHCVCAPYEKKFCKICQSGKISFCINYDLGDVYCAPCYETIRPKGAIEKLVEQRQAELYEELNMGNMTPHQRKLVCMQYLKGRGLGKFTQLLTCQEILCAYSGRYGTSCNTQATVECVLSHPKLKPVYVCDKHSDQRYFREKIHTTNEM